MNRLTTLRHTSRSLAAGALLVVGLLASRPAFAAPAAAHAHGHAATAASTFQGRHGSGHKIQPLCKPGHVC
jgi:hypothetical protein